MMRGRCPHCNRLYLFTFARVKHIWWRWMPHICTADESVFYVPLRTGDRARNGGVKVISKERGVIPEYQHPS